MFLIDYIFFAIGVIFLFFFLLTITFSNNFFDFVVDTDIHCIVCCLGIAFCLVPFLFNLLFNRCDVCKTYVSSDYCTDCGSFVASESLCFCGAEINEKYKYCPSCGSDLEVSCE